MEIESLSLERGFLAKPKKEGAFPAILLIHEWWGLNHHICGIASRLAAEGYVALAPDLYHGKVTTDAQEAADLMEALDMDNSIAIIEKDYQYLSEQAFVKKDAIGIMGFCMGGSLALLAACRLKGLKGAVPFYGQAPQDKKELAAISCPILFFAGGQDSWISPEVVQAMRSNLEAQKINAEVVTFDEADHAFFNDTRPEVYHREAALKSWQQALEFFKKNLA